MTTADGQEATVDASGGHPHRELVPCRRSDADAWAEGAGSRAWFVDLTDHSQWFDTLVISELAPGATDGPRVYDAESPAETWYQLTDTPAELLMPDGRIEALDPFDAVFLRPGSGAELRAGADPLTWLTIASAGGRPTPFSQARERGETARCAIDLASDPVVFHRRRVAPRQWPANPLGASAKPWWFYTVDERSRWFHSSCVSCVAPGGASTFHTHMERFEGPYETFYLVLHGSALIRGEFGDASYDEPPCGVFVPTDAAHQIINNGEDLLWYLTVSSRGGAELLLDTYNVPSGVDRPGYLDEYNRIVAARAGRGLATP